MCLDFYVLFEIINSNPPPVLSLATVCCIVLIMRKDCVAHTVLVTNECDPESRKAFPHAVSCVGWVVVWIL